MTEDRKPNAPTIFDYDNYRLFLRDTYQWRKARKKAFSFRLFSRMAGFGAPNFLKRIMEGSRNLSAASIPKCAKALGFNKSEAEFFSNLVHFNQTRSLEERQKYARELMRSRVYRSLRPLAKMQFEYWSKWFHVVIREMVELKGFVEDAGRIARHLLPPIKADEVESAIDKLLALEILRRNDSGQLACTDHYISTGDQVMNASVAHFHQEMLRKAGEALNHLPATERHISSVTVAVSPQGMEKMTAMIDAFRKDLLSAANEDEEKDRVIQINFQAFPLTRKWEES